MCIRDRLYAILFSLPGAPVIYFGDEIGMGENIWLNDRDGVRTPMQWSAGKNAGFSDRADDQLYLPVIDEGEYSYKHLNVENQLKDSHSLFNRLRELIAIRKKHEVLSSTQLTVLFRNNSAVFAVLRGNKSDGLICLHNLSQQTQQLDISPFTCQTLHHSSNQALKNINLEDGDIQLEPYAYVWLKIHE
jgi:maltose alpha-D-glucosyltransferase/alpha-amylase